MILTAKPPHGLVLAALLATLTVTRGGSLAGSYVDTTYFTTTGFGSHSHWLQPWRASLETVPAQNFVAGIGMGLDSEVFTIPSNGVNLDMILQMLSRHGVTRARVEIGWANVDYANPSQLDNSAAYRVVLQSCQKWGVRPLILLNGNEGAPCPALFFNRTVTASAAAGATTVQLNDVSGLISGKSGLCNLSTYRAAEAIITAINGNTATLSKPLPNAVAAGSAVLMTTLKYRPFSDPVNDAASYNETMAGWTNYVDVIAKFVAGALGTTNSTDRGFDLEIWNELSFGSAFLSINNYYNPPAYSYNANAIWSNLVAATVGFAGANPSEFQNVSLGDGFANTIPWPASSDEPARLNTINKHPYPPLKNFPADEQSGQAYNALEQPDSYVPAYTALFPEYFGTTIQTETLLRDSGPISNSIYGTWHGRYARANNPCPVWITEVGIAPDQNGITDAAAALALKAKTTARFYCFYLDKGVTQVDLYAAGAGDEDLGIVLDAFVNYTKTNSTYPADDSSYTSPALLVTSRIVNKMKEQLDPNLTVTQPLQVLSISDTHDHYQFAGDGTAAHPPLYDREVFAFLPYQVNSSRYVVPYYVMTRDVRQSLAPEQFTLQIGGLNGKVVTAAAYDPINDASVPVSAVAANTNSLTLAVTAADYPYLLTLQALPTLSATIETNCVVLSWNSSSSNDVLQVTGSLVPPVSWGVVNGAIQFAGVQRTMRLLLTSSNQFFRIRQ